MFTVRKFWGGTHPYMERWDIIRTDRVNKLFIIPKNVCFEPSSKQWLIREQNMSSRGLKYWRSMLDKRSNWDHSCLGRLLFPLISPQLAHNVVSTFLYRYLDVMDVKWTSIWSCVMARSRHELYKILSVCKVFRIFIWWKCCLSVLFSLWLYIP